MEKNIAEVEHKFSEYLKQKGLRVTPQRLKILDAFMSTDEHVSMEELFLLVRSKDSTVGQVTVYRTLKLLCEAGIASAVNFEEGMVRYEPVGMHHHDHLVCEKCGRKIEFVNNAIESLQEKVCRVHDFIPTSHHMVLYGICAECRKKA
ncbi:Fur family transcriptional regulator [Mailhella massiliensis]|uniref:Ferric uptake regulation protein n=1 Tax=Mailhella massiliensis TaxID=1903261 RepID=A0A921DRY2_9BACT|nr:transcriptional repressor [Mailhella massiliensis]HJD97578.1 transcriptional repressor [Mailhella massiliensis]